MDRMARRKQTDFKQTLLENNIVSLSLSLHFSVNPHFSRRGMAGNTPQA
jgi:hypothetical protein